MEFCRRWGIVNSVQNSDYPRERPQDNVYVTSLAGFELGRHSVPAMSDTVSPLESPEHNYRCPQHLFDPILLEHVRRYPHVSVLHNVEMVGLIAGDERVEVELLDQSSQTRRTVSAEYVVGCDGAGSATRQVMGANMVGAGVLTYTTNVIFRSTDATFLRATNDGYRWIFIGPEGTWATLVAINGRDEWRFSIIGSASPHVPQSSEIEQAIERAAGGRFHYEILSVVPWSRREAVASSYRRGRVFIAGDAAHVMSPTGGFGMNTGIGDAVDLGWKLEAVLNGWGGAGLFEAYEPERRPVAVRNSREATANLGRMLAPREREISSEMFEPGRGGDEVRASFGREFSELMSSEWNTLDIHLGYVYDRSPICLYDGGDGQRLGEGKAPRVGARAPHARTEDGGSTLDWFGRGFVIVTLDGTEKAAEPLLAAGRAEGIPLQCRTAASGEAAVRYSRLLTLVRPDGHVCWSSDDIPGQTTSQEILRFCSGRLPASDNDHGEGPRGV